MWILVTLWTLALLIMLGTQWLKGDQTATAQAWVDEATSAEEAILAENWGEAEIRVRHLRTSWERIRRAWSLYTEHVELDEITDALTETKAHIAIKDPGAVVPLRRAKDRMLTLPERDAWDLENIF